MKFSLRLVSVCALALATFGSTQALGAPGGGAIKAEGPCEITVPGFGEAVGTAKILITPSGKQKVTCNAQLVSGSTFPEKTVFIPAGPCVLMVTSSGNVNERC